MPVSYFYPMGNYFAHFSGGRFFIACFKFTLCLLTHLILFSVFLQAGLKAQCNQEKSNVLKKYRQADALYNLEAPTTESDQQALNFFVEVAKSSLCVENDLKVHALIKGGNIHLGYNRFAEANSLYHWAIQLNKPVNQELNYEVCLYIGSSMYFNGVIDSAKLYFERASEISVNNRNKLKLPEQDRLYNSLGAIYYQSANYQQALNYLQTALDFASPGAADFEELYTSIQSNIASCLLKLNLYDSSLNILRKLNRFSPNRDFVIQNMAHTYFETGQYDTAMAIYKRLPEVTGLFRVVALNDIGRIYLYKNNWKRARELFDSALVVNRSITGNVKNKEEALTYLYLSELYQKQGKTDAALTWCNRAIIELHLSGTSAPVNEIPDDISQTVSPIIFYQVLNFRGELLYRKYIAGKNPALLFASLKTLVKAVEVANYISKNLDNDDAKLFFIENAERYYEQAVKIAYEASELNPQLLDDLVFILEGYKGNILRQNLEVTNLKLNSGIPDSLIKREGELKGLYAVYLSKLNQVTDEKESSRIQKKLSSIQVSLSRLQKSYEKYEVFTWVKSNRFDKGLTIDEIRRSIDHKTALVNYFVSDTAIYLLAVSKTEVKASRVAISASFKANLRKYMQECFRIVEGIRYEGFAASHEIFRKLLGPVNEIVEDNPRLVIIPDKYLFQLPFDGLISSNNGERQYLVKEHSISVHYSFSLLMQGLSNNSYQSLNKEGILAFAPFSEWGNDTKGGSNLFLPFSGQEIDQPGASKFFAAGATKERFMKEYRDFGIIHLATHASLGNDSSTNWIQFYPGNQAYLPARMYVHEVYNLHLAKNGLVILSACESGAGLTMGGEGLLSLSRAFMYAGAGGIISTLYKTDDLVTAFLMKRLYVHMNEGMAPAEALHQSKIDLLETDELNPRLKTPNYWSNFVYVGKISVNRGKNYYWVLWLILPLFIAGYFYRKKPGKPINTISS